MIEIAATINYITLAIYIYLLDMYCKFEREANARQVSLLQWPLCCWHNPSCFTTQVLKWVLLSPLTRRAEDWPTVSWENQWEKTFSHEKFAGLPFCFMLCLIIHPREGSQDRNTSLSVTVSAQCLSMCFLSIPALMKLPSSHHMISVRTLRWSLKWVHLQRWLHIHKPPVRPCFPLLHVQVLDGASLSSQRGLLLLAMDSLGCSVNPGLHWLKQPLGLASWAGI